MAMLMANTLAKSAFFNIFDKTFTKKEARMLFVLA
jgi:hypothetical protein